MAITVKEYDIFRGYKVGDTVEFERLITPVESSYRFGKSFLGTLAKDANDNWILNKVGYINEWYPEVGIDDINNMQWKPTYDINDVPIKNVPNWTVKLRKFIETNTSLPGEAVKMILGIITKRDNTLYTSINLIKPDTPSGEITYNRNSTAKPHKIN